MHYSTGALIRGTVVMGAVSFVAFCGIALSMWGTAHAATGLGTLVLTEAVDGGTASPSDFTVQLRKSGLSSGVSSGSGDVITFSRLTPGTYLLTDSGGPAGYRTTWSGACNGRGTVTIAADATAACTITHTFGPVGSLKVVEVVNGGTASPSDFTVHLKKSGAADTGSPSGSGSIITFSQLAPGAYTVIESGVPAGYRTSWSGACNAQGNVTVTANATATCTSTHTFASSGRGGGGGGIFRIRLPRLILR